MNNSSSEQSMHFSMDELIGCSKRQIVSYYGAPSLDYPNLSVFSCDGGNIAVSFRMDNAISYVLYNNEKVQVYSTINTLALTKEKVMLWTDKLFSDFVSKYGLPHSDMGSGFFIPAYFSDHGSMFAFQIVNKKICRITELDFFNKLQG